MFAKSELAVGYHNELTPRRKDVLPGFCVGEMSSPSTVKHFNNLKLHA